ncbi:glutathione S-transferase [Rhodobium orientis]|uniref:Glutathione S-transferase n=1 Tax=Rhodobium orientis TaxID=34017 RepID=A0A327JPS3_9HYPH|nr:glutathione S-transferase family protein [Rhodobium orientis]MBB4304866.1 glutathione S-transferase [Rhodobium orientis]MBK5949195.1 glutathione S-transferase [Rhodobium orientis]RAI27364.1 glutathione S-transferase [Rhodobium orientis]
MADYTLYCFAQSGNAYKAALMLELSAADWEPRFVDFFNGETRTPEYRALNVMGEVPVLVHGDVKLSQSGVILDYLTEALGNYRPVDEAERREVLRWTLFDNHKLTSYVATLRFLRTFAKSGDPAVIDFLESRAKGSLAVLDAQLKSRDFVAGERPTTADFSLCGYLFWPDEIGIDLAAYPAVTAWLDRIRALPGWKHPYDLMPGHPLPEKD